MLMVNNKIVEPSVPSNVRFVWLLWASDSVIGVFWTEEAAQYEFDLLSKVSPLGAFRMQKRMVGE